jgi:hypothetical protein
MWRQTFGLSFATNYMQEDRGLFSPALHWEDPEGYRESASEFPLYYYIIGNLWKLTGKSHLLYRLLSLMLLYAGTCCLFLLIRKLSGSLWVSYGFSLLYFLSPIMTVYGNQFVIDAPIVNLTLVALFLLYQYQRSSQLIWLLTGYGILTICGMTKPTVLMPLFALSLSFFPQLSGKEIKIHFIGHLSILLGTSAWILYVEYYNAAHSGLLFLRSATPIWTLSREKIGEILPMFFSNVLPYWMPISGLIALLSIQISSLFYPISTPFVWVRRCTILGWLAGIAYILLFFQIMDVHDYYMLELVWLIPATLVHGYLTFKNFFENTKAGFIWLRAGIMIAVLAMTLRSTAYYRLRHNPHDTVLTQVEDWVTPREIEFFRWVQYDFDQNYKPLLEIAPLLNTMGIAQKSRIAVLPDPSPCTALYMLNRHGFSGYHYTPEFIADLNYPEYFSKRGADYYILHDRNLFSDPKYVSAPAKLMYATPAIRLYTLQIEK